MVTVVVTGRQAAADPLETSALILATAALEALAGTVAVAVTVPGVLALGLAVDAIPSQEFF